MKTSNLDHLTPEMALQTQISLVEFSWNGLAFNLAGDLFLLEPLHPQWIRLH